MLNLIKKIPFVISCFVLFNFIILNIERHSDINLIYRIKKVLFNPKNPFYFNYWIIYTVVAIVISIVLTLIRKYTVHESIFTLLSNGLLCMALIIFVITNM